MATITTNTYLDDGTARTAGEAWAINGGILTIRTDTRVHVGAPASMTGTLGSLTTSASLGGGVLIDSTNVRWMPFDNGAGNVPAIGETITGATSGANGYLLGVWADYTSAPTTPGSAMPATGYIKLREADAAYVNNDALTATGASGMTADANGVDRQGWIEVVERQLATNNVPRLGSFVTRGGWFELDQTTSGSANDIIQVPTNGGGSGTHVPALWIETGSGTGVFEQWPALSSTYFLAANLSTDIRSKFVNSIGDGQLRIGYDGTTNAGYVPAAGCRIRIPSNIGRQCTSAAGDANNLEPFATLSTRPDFATTSAGRLDFEYFINDWYHVFSSAYSVRHIHVATFDAIVPTNNAAAFEFEDVCTGSYAAAANVSFEVTACTEGGTVTDCKFYRGNAGSNGHSISIVTTLGMTLTNVETGVITYTRSTGRLSISQSSDIELNNCSQTAVYTNIATSTNIRINNLDHTDRFVGTTIATTALYGVTSVTSSDNVTLDGMTFGKNGAIADVNPYNAPVYSANSSNVTYRNIGTRAAPLGVCAGFEPTFCVHDAGANVNFKAQRVYLAATRSNVISTLNTSTDSVFESISSTVGSILVRSNNTLAKGMRATNNSVSAASSTYGSHTFDMFESDTVGRIWWAMQEPTAFSNSYVTLTLNGATGGFTSAGQVSMPTVGDQLIIETPYYVLGHTAFDNSAPTLTGTLTGNFDYEYDIDVNDGGGFTGTYQTLNGANLSAETIDPALGFKLRLRITCNTGATTNAITYVRITTASTAVAQDNLYPLDTANPTLTLTGLEVGTEVVVFNDDYTQELDREVLVGTTFTYNYEWISDDGNFDVNILVWKDDKVPFIETVTLTDEDQSIPLTQDPDLVYDGTYTNTHTIDFANELIILDSFEYDVQQVYSLWKDEILLTTNAQYSFAFTQVGGDATGGGRSIPYYTFLSNGWKVRPQEANGTTEVVVGILLTDDDSDPFVDTLGAYTVRINYQQPVQVIALATSGSSITPAQVADAVWDEALADHLTAGTTGKKLKDNLTQNNFLALK